MLRKLLASEVKFTLTAEQDDLPVRGNAMVSGDAAADKEVEDEIIARLDKGDIWAWASVKVTAEWNGYKGVNHLGACTCDNEQDFIVGNSDYYSDMCDNALDELNNELESAYNVLAQLIKKD